MQRIYLSDFDSQSEIIQIKDTEIIHQLTKVLRSRIGDKISIFNGKDSQDHIFEIIELAKREISIKKESHLENNSEILFELSLYN
jgi:16S rRNA U1498 N3-methylase RsmE